MLVTAVGLEHTGHHVWWGDGRDLQSGVFGRLSQYALHVEASWVMYDTFWQQPAFTHVQRNLSNGVSRIATEFRFAHGEHMWVPINSYPGGTCHVRGGKCSIPDVRLLWQSARLASVDMRFLLLTRPAFELIYDSLWPRDGYVAERVDLLTRSCRKMQRHLNYLPQSHVLCLPYHATCNNTERLARLDQFLDVPGASKVLCERFHKTRRHRPPVSPPLHTKFEELLSCTTRVEAQHC